MFGMGTGVTSLPSSLDLTMTFTMILNCREYVLSKLDTTFPNVMHVKDKPSTD